MRAFSYNTEKGTVQIGLEFLGATYNFSQAWEAYKGLHSQGKGPSLPFLQLMVEADFFSVQTFHEVMNSLREAEILKILKMAMPAKINPPIGRPQKVLCIGRNYKLHAEELGNEAPEEPIFFSKSPSSLLAHEEPICIPQGVGRVDFEGELAVVIGKCAQNVTKHTAMAHVAGFSLINDITARDLQKTDIEAGKPWFRSKSFDSFCPFGPYLVPTEALETYNQLEIEVRVNGEKRQHGQLKDMIFGIPELVAYLSKHCTLEPGDVIATGTPAGVGALQSGDVVECEIDSIGTLRNPVE
ncbi:fumarylacetoacetate hydrolase family protein [bacterium]|nr:fumarylacetoacetate hydrolase family protein [bacterium]